MKKHSKKFIYGFLALCLLMQPGCKKEELVINTVAVTPNTLNLASTLSTDSIRITTDAGQWSISSDAPWVQFSQTSGTNAKTTIRVSASANPETTPRTAIISLTAGNAPVVQINLTQLASLFPGYNSSPQAPDANGMSSTAVQLAPLMNRGINIGNTLEAIGGETAWGNPLITKAYIDLIKQSGFTAVRLPCSWNQYANTTTAQISSTWLDRVKQVVQYCVDDNLYVILNIHWDGGWLENNCTVDKQVVNNAKQKAFWEQIATKLRDFDEHVMFASANEPNVSDATQMGVLLSYHQTFIDAVRSTGGKNSYRVLVVQGPNTDIATTNQLMTKLPVDSVPNKMMVEIHYYTPWNFTGMSKDETWGNMFYYWGKNYHSTTDTAHNPTWGEESDVDKYFKLMKTQFVDKGIPVVVGEYGTMLRTNLTGAALTLHLASRIHYYNYTTVQARANGLLPFVWDTGDVGAVFNRKTNTVLNQQELDALLQ